jgi:superoxide dismutase, Cu-Zn family
LNRLSAVQFASQSLTLRGIEGYSLGQRVLGGHMTRMTTLFAVALSATCLACGDEKTDDAEHDESTSHHSGGETAAATLAAKSDNTTLAGTVTFSGEAGKISVKVDLTGAPAGQHGLHIHEKGDCSDAMAMNAGGHWNPGMLDHGMPGAAPSHLGDLGNITVAADGTGTLTYSNPMWEIGTKTANDVQGKAVIVHANPDDFGQPVGNAGGRIGCGVIQ